MEQQDNTYRRKVGELRLMLENPRNQAKVYVLVEGISDKKLYRKLVDREKCQIEYIPGGSGKVEDAMEVLLELHNWTIGIRDADFLRLNGERPRHAVTFLTDGHDEEMMMVKDGGVFKNILDEYSEEPEEDLATLREKIMDTLRPLSCIKWYNSRLDEGVDCSSMSFIKYLNRDVSQLNVDEWAGIVAQKSRGRIDKATLLAEAATLGEQQVDGYDLTNGHDFTAALANYFKESHGVKGVSKENIESMLRSNYSLPAFKNTQLYQALQQWATAHNTQLFPEEAAA